jgi:hypothetical protein
VIAAIFLAFISGIAGTLLFAMWFAARPETEARPQHNGIAATSVSLNGNSGESMDAHHARLLNETLTKIGEQKLFEIRTRH